MRAIKLKSRVSSDHRLNVQLPEDVPEGEAEVIVLVSEREEEVAVRQQTALKEFFAHLDRLSIPRRTKEEIDRYLDEERASWERS